MNSGSKQQKVVGQAPPYDYTRKWAVVTAFGVVQKWDVYKHYQDGGPITMSKGVLRKSVACLGGFLLLAMFLQVARTFISAGQDNNWTFAKCTLLPIIILKAAI
jgi:hypothetical protein